MLTAVVLAALLAGVWLAAAYRENGSRAILLPDQVMTLFPAPKPLAAFAFKDHEDRVFDLSRLRGKWSFLFFGYTHCPDFCPTALLDISAVFKELGPDKKVAALFVTVDPERDTPDILKTYLANFDSRIIGLSGDPSKTEAIAKAFRVYKRCLAANPATIRWITPGSSISWTGAANS